MEETILKTEDLCAGFPGRRGEIRAVDHVSLEVKRGRITALVGESGCGKSMTARAVMNLMRYPGRVTGGRVLLDGQDLTKMKRRERRALMGSRMSMIFQDPMTSLNPVVRIGKQVDEVLRVHEHLSGEEARKRTIRMLADAGVPDPERRYRNYPHELSGGLRQRVMIAMAMICKPALLLADEPTTALDVTVEAQILSLMKRLRDEGTGILLISHNLGAVAQVCDDVCVMYAGKIVEQGDVFTIFERPAHPYTQGLLGAVASLRAGAETLETIPGTVPQLQNLPQGCSFAPRCPLCRPECRMRTPELRETENGHRVRCLAAEEAAGQ